MSISAQQLQQVFEEVALERTGSRAQREALVYHDLKQIARRISGRVRPGATLATTDLLHEAWARMSGSDLSVVNHQRQFMALAATIMHRVAVDHVRERVSQKRGGKVAKVSLEEATLQADDGDPGELILQLHEGLTQLREVPPDLAELAELLFFVGLTQKEVAGLRGVSEVTVRRDWRKARAWLFRHLSTPPAQPKA